MLRGGRFSQGVLSGDPAPGAITLLTVVDERRRRRARAARGRARPRLPARDRPPRHPHLARGRPLRQGARDRPQAAPALLLPLRDARPPQPGRALPDGAAARLAGDRALRLLLLRRLHARLLQRLRAAGPRRPRLRRLARRLHLRRELLRGRRRARRPRRPIGKPNPYYRTTVHEAATLPEYRAKYALYRTDESLRQLHATVPDRRDLGRPRGPEQLRERRRGRRPAAARPLLPRAPGRRLPGVLRVDARLPARGLADLPDGAVRAHGRPDDARPAPVPRQPAVRRRARVPVRQLGPPALDARPPPARVPRSSAWRRPRPRGR